MYIPLSLFYIQKCCICYIYIISLSVSLSCDVSFTFQQWCASVLLKNQIVSSYLAFWMLHVISYNMFSKPKEWNTWGPGSIQRLHTWSYQPVPNKPSTSWTVLPAHFKPAPQQSRSQHHWVQGCQAFAKHNGMKLFLASEIIWKKQPWFLQNNNLDLGGFGHFMSFWSNDHRAKCVFGMLQAKKIRIPCLIQCCQPAFQHLLLQPQVLAVISRVVTEILLTWDFEKQGEVMLFHVVSVFQLIMSFN